MVRKVITSGFVYIWFDRKHKRFYIGSHWGSTTDKYICSSTWMRDAYKRRPQDFKRRIIETVNSSRQELYSREYSWLSLIKDEELGKRYYNLRKWEHGSIEYTDEMRAKMASSTGKTPTQETIAKRVETIKKTLSTPEKKLELSAQATATWEIPGHREAIAAGMTALWKTQEHRDKTIPAMIAGLNSPECIQKISDASLKNWQDPDYRQKVAESKIGMIIIPPRTEEQNLNNSVAQTKLWATEEHKQKMVAAHLNSEVATASSKANIRKTHTPEAKAKSKEMNRLRREREAEIRAADPIAAAEYAKKIKDDARARAMKRWHPELVA